jgi:hypothetical protein
MQFTPLVLWRFISLLIIFIPLTTCYRPEPHCDSALGQHLDRIYCSEARQQFITHRNAVLGVYTAASSRRRYYFSHNPRASVPEGGRLIDLPLSFSSQGCRITIYLPVIATWNPAEASWANISSAITEIFRQCLESSSSTGGIVLYHGLAIAIAQHPHIADYPVAYRSPVPMASNLAWVFDQLLDPSWK